MCSVRPLTPLEYNLTIILPLVSAAHDWCARKDDICLNYVLRNIHTPSPKMAADARQLVKPPPCDTQYIPEFGAMRLPSMERVVGSDMCSEIERSEDQQRLDVPYIRKCVVCLFYLCPLFNLMGTNPLPFRPSILYNL